MPKAHVLQVDPDVKVPAAVLAAAARADELVNGLSPQAPPTEPIAPAPPAAEPATPAEVPAAEAALALAPSVEPTSPAAEPAAPVTHEVISEDTWQHKYNSMKGRHDAQAKQMLSMSEQIRNLQDLVANVSTPAPAAAPAPTRLVTPEETAEWGPEFFDVVSKRVQEVVAPLQQQVESLSSRTKQEANARTAANKATFYHELNTKQADWTTINKDQNFLNWLALPEAYSGAIRHELLKAAFEQNDAPRVLAFFKGFLAEEAALAPKSGQPDVVAAVTPPPKIPLESLAAPGRAKTAATPAGVPAEKPTFSRAQVSQFYLDIAAGKYDGRTEEKNRLDAQIFEAGREGRITA